MISRCRKKIEMNEAYEGMLCPSKPLESFGLPHEREYKKLPKIGKEDPVQKALRQEGDKIGQAQTRRLSRLAELSSTMSSWILWRSHELELSEPLLLLEPESLDPSLPTQSSHFSQNFQSARTKLTRLRARKVIWTRNSIKETWAWKMPNSLPIAFVCSHRRSSENPGRRCLPPFVKLRAFLQRIDDSYAYDSKTSLRVALVILRDPAGGSCHPAGDISGESDSRFLASRKSVGMACFAEEVPAVW